jgi:hypothetical protein
MLKNGQMVNSLETGKASEGSDWDLIKVLSQYFPGGTEETMKTLRTTGVLAEVRTYHV